MTIISIKGVITSEEYAWFYDWFDEPYTTAERFKAQLDAAGDDVVVEVNSPGGLVTAGAEIYEAIRGYSGNIECHVVGQAASAASFIVCAAKSSISPLGFLFLHNCLGSVSGNHNDMREAAQMLESIDENIMGAYREKTGMTDAQIYRLMERNTTLSATKAVELGFIDRISSGAEDGATTNQGAVTRIAAAAPGYLDPTALGADRLEALRKVYMESKHGQCGGGENMTIEDINAVDEDSQRFEPAEGEPGDGAATDAEAGQETDETEAAETEDGAPAGEDDADAEDGSCDDDAECEPEEDMGDGVSDFDAGVLAERERVAGIMDIAERVPKAMVHAALFTDPISAEQLALRAMRAEDSERAAYAAKARADVAASNSALVQAAVAEPVADGKAEQKRMLKDELNRKYNER